MDLCEVQKTQRSLVSEVRAITTRLDSPGGASGGRIVLEAAEDLLRSVAIATAEPIGAHLAAAILPLHDELRKLRMGTDAPVSSPLQGWSPIQLRNPLATSSPLASLSQEQGQHLTNYFGAEGSPHILVSARQRQSPRDGGLGKWADAFGGEGPLGQIAEWVHGSFGQGTPHSVKLDAQSHQVILNSRESYAPKIHANSSVDDDQQEEPSSKKFHRKEIQQNSTGKRQIQAGRRASAPPLAFEPGSETSAPAVAAELGFGVQRHGMEAAAGSGGKTYDSASLEQQSVTTDYSKGKRQSLSTAHQINLMAKTPRSTQQALGSSVPVQAQSIPLSPSSRTSMLDALNSNQDLHVKSKDSTSETPNVHESRDKSTGKQAARTRSITASKHHLEQKDRNPMHINTNLDPQHKETGAVLHLSKGGASEKAEPPPQSPYTGRRNR